MSENNNFLEDYPIIDGHRKHYVHHPVKNSRGYWEAADVYIHGNGGHSPLNNPARSKFRHEADCKRGCDIHNRYHGWTNEQINQIIGLSMLKSQNS